MYMPESNPNGIRNLNILERWLSMIGGGALTTWGLRRGSRRGFFTTLAGGYLVQRGLTGHCAIYRLLGINTANRPKTHYQKSWNSAAGQYDSQADQAEGERGEWQTSTRVGKTPGSAEGDRETVENDLQSKSPARGL